MYQIGWLQISLGFILAAFPDGTGADALWNFQGEIRGWDRDL